MELLLMRLSKIRALGATGGSGDQSPGRAEIQRASAVAVASDALPSRRTRGGNHRRRPKLHGPLDRTLAMVACIAAVAALLVMLGVPSTHSNGGLVIRGAALTLFWVSAPGAAAVPHLRLTSATKIALVPTLSLSALIAVGTLAAWTGIWIPQLMTVGLAALCLVSCVTVLRNVSRRRAR